MKYATALRLGTADLLQASLVHVDTLLPQQALAETGWAKKPTSYVNPYGAFRLDMVKGFDLAPLAVPHACPPVGCLRACVRRGSPQEPPG
ncbi:hypothetical protein IM697_22170 [Streptomyces ferrugineus]|uniref:Tn3 transposase DDE domain-containing protein n=1 Tax=Streptomyces ferrugineus TaxID=1413221 RepID=A0A7M2SX35_9ACTN|nr:hypothetical protein [Streptomyces ferrugineus]QOV40852.1 hypothetical protein IM697_22170 [Streptomyces ferrugineus]